MAAILDLTRRGSSPNEPIDLLEEEEKDEEVEIVHVQQPPPARTRMLWTTTGRACRFVEELVQTHARILSAARGRNQNTQFRTFATDDLVFMVERLIHEQENLKLRLSACTQKNFDTNVSIVFHYTSTTNLSGIRANGLLHHKDREERKVKAHKFHGATFGHGIYTSNNPFAFQKYGKVCLILAVLKGRTENVDVESLPRVRSEIARAARKGAAYKCDNVIDTLIGNKHVEKRSGSHLFHDQIILTRRDQCAPLIQALRKSAISRKSFDAKLFRKYYEELQKLLDRYFNNGVATPVMHITRP